MSNELPHALLKCSECGTAFRVTLKKGRPPSKPVPCPKCKTPITVTQEDIRGGKKTKATTPRPSSELRETRVANVLRKTQEVSADPLAAAKLLYDMPPSDPPTRDVPTAENEAVAKQDVPASSTPAFGIVTRKKIRGHTSTDTSTDYSLAVASPGVHVVKGEGDVARDEVFADTRPRPRTRSGVALGRISPKRIAAGSMTVDVDDPDLPAPAGDVPPQPGIEVAESAEAAGDGEETAKPRPKLSLARLKAAVAKREAERSEAREEPPKRSVEVQQDGGIGDIDLALEAASDADFGGEFEGVELSEASDLAFDDLEDVEEMDLPLPNVAPPPPPFDRAALDADEPSSPDSEVSDAGDEGQVSDADDEEMEVLADDSDGPQSPDDVSTAPGDDFPVTAIAVGVTLAVLVAIAAIYVLFL